jgi:hypothetical protein
MDDPREGDLIRALKLVYGIGRGGKVTYLEEGSPNELEARRALARLLGGGLNGPWLPLDPRLRVGLRDLIDPDCDSAERCIKFGHRRRGKRSSPEVEKRVAEFIRKRIKAGDPLKVAADEKATAKFGLKRARVRAIWKQWQPILERINRRSQRT